MNVKYFLQNYEMSEEVNLLIKRPVDIDKFLKDIYIYYDYKGFLPYFLSFFLIRLSFFSVLCFLNIPIIYLFPLYILFMINPVMEICNSRSIYTKYSLMNIINEDIKTMKWETLVRQIENLQKETNFIINGMKVNSLNICRRMMRIENYKTAFYSHNVLNEYISFTLEKNLDIIIFNDLIDSFIRKDITHKKIKTLAVINLLLTPITISYVILYFLFDYVTETYLKKEYKKRHLTPRAFWFIREYNELPHQYRQRMPKIIEHYDNYLRNFTNPIYSYLAKFFILISFLLSFKYLINDIVKMLSILLPILKFLNYFITDECYCDMKQELEDAFNYSHIYPDKWKGYEESTYVCKKVEAIVPTKLTLLMWEIRSIIRMPYFLWKVLPSYIDDINIFFTKITYTDDYVGSVCKYSNFELDNDSLHECEYISEKIEKSYISFNNAVNFQKEYNEFSKNKI